MPSDWSDPDRAERELAKREGREPSGTDPPADGQDLAEAVPAMRRMLERLEAETASQTEDIASLGDMLARIDGMLAAERASPPVPPEGAPGTDIVQAEGRITAHIDRVEEHIDPVARAMPAVREMAKTASAVPHELGELREAVDKLTHGLGRLTSASSENSLRQTTVARQISEKLKEAEGGMTGRFQGEAQHVRDVLQRTAATVLERRRLSKRLRWILAGAVLLGVLACIAVGVWLQWELEPVAPKATTGGS